MSASSTDPERIVRIKVELDDFSPPIWRRVELPLTASLKQLHDAIQAMMLFENYHLFDFRIAYNDEIRRYGIPDPDDEMYGVKVFDAKNIRLGAIVERGVTTFSYLYDFGDSWRHTVTIEAVELADPTVDYPRFVDGERRAPPEDVGGIQGFEDFLAAMAKPRHRERKRMIEWYGSIFDPNDISLVRVTNRLKILARRRLMGKVRAAKARKAVN